MPYGECKIYSDGSHFIAIPHTTRPYRKRKKPPEEEITVAETQENTAEGSTFPDITVVYISAVFVAVFQYEITAAVVVIE